MLASRRWLVSGILAGLMGVFGAAVLTGIAYADPAPRCAPGYVAAPASQWCMPKATP